MSQGASLCSEQTKQSQIHPGAGQLAPFSVSPCPLLEPRLAWGSPGGGSCSLDREGVNGPQASGSASSYACNFLSSFFPSSFPRFPPRRPPPAQGGEVCVGGWPDDQA